MAQRSLDDELRRLVAAGVLTEYQADGLRAAANADLRGIQQHNTGPATEPDQDDDSVLVEVLGYVGGALLFGAVALLVIVNWSEMGRGARILTSAGSAVVLLGAAAILVSFRRIQLASALTALGSGVAGFATFVVVEDTAGRVAGVLVASLLAGAGLWLLRGALLLAAIFAALSVGVFVVVFDLIDETGARDDTAGLAGMGFVFIAAGFGLLGEVRDRVTAWSLAGAGVFAAAICWLVQDDGEAVALGIGTAGSVALLAAYGIRRSAAYAVIGCTILLVVWPTGLYQLTENVAAVAGGLVAASAALITAVVVFARRRPAG